ncbi:MAG: thioredoxin-disulfide reductase [Candidatus Nealsonbacteria bacterium CG08_land_8_20_14_0_20_38_20]|uniref:Thioredoxin-disulfide reductase n=1 Tax=Candidatus Nealsonbacteria bacterium CG08_land_8_20_14_0_20_38_20 TaxID=1974705 RepID=A0A2H0YN98_9BACT|nr:MAG: thioredoxin-disulfide reductase [Candidatus Nealsonbacteria bacterium CG08_land_8_20_14_0_20_38_20]
MLYDLIIVGGGPAGITAGIYAVRQKINTLLITKDFGGQLARKAGLIENYPGFEEISGLDLIQKFEKHLRAQKIDIEFDQVVRVEKLTDNFSVLTKGKNKFGAKTVIIASGADPRQLEVPGEKEFIGKGVSYCTLCDAPLFSNKTVAVIGGGNSGFEAAIALNKWAKKIYILETGPEVRAEKENQEAVKKTGKVEILTSVVLKKIQGEKFVNSLNYEDGKTGKEMTMAIDGIFVEIGYQPATSFVRDLVEFNERDEIKVDLETFETKTPGLFAAGDCNTGKYKQIVTAAGEGAKAALAAYDYLQNLQKPELRVESNK